MSRKPTGSASTVHGKFYARVTVNGKRKGYPLLHITDMAAARARATLMNFYAKALEKADKHGIIDRFMKEAGAARDADLPAFDGLVDGVVAGIYVDGLNNRLSSISLTNQQAYKISVRLAELARQEAALDELVPF